MMKKIVKASAIIVIMAMLAALYGGMAAQAGTESGIRAGTKAGIQTVAQGSTRAGIQSRAAGGDRGSDNSKAIDIDGDISKDENIYISLESDGTFKNVYIINAFLLKEEGVIEDYGEYDKVVNLSTAERLAAVEGKISASAPAGWFYYQGNKSAMETPWLIAISYFLNEKEVSAQELSGATGVVKIKISIRQNPNAVGEFAEHYAVQTSVTLDAGLCTAIEAAGATIANAGGSKVITFTMLPGGEADYTVSAQVNDFHMNGIQITGVPLAISMDGVDTSLFAGKLSDLSGGIAELDNGAMELTGGISELKDGAFKLSDGIKGMQSGLAQLTDGLRKLSSQNAALTSGSAEIREGLTAILNGLQPFGPVAGDLSALTGGSASVKAGIESLSSGLKELKESFQRYQAQLSQNNLDVDGTLNANGQMIAAISSQIPALKARLAGETSGTEAYIALQTQITTYEQAVQLFQVNTGIIAANQQFLEQLQAGIGEAAAGSMELSGSYGQLDAGIQAMPSMLNDLPGSISELKYALSALSAGYEKLHSGIIAYTGGVGEISTGCKDLETGCSGLVKGSGSLYSGMEELYDGARQLSDGLNELRKGTSSMDTEIKKAMDEVLESYTGGDFEIVSFISPKNKNVKSVQFVMQTTGIEEKVKNEPVPEKEVVSLTFWERLLALFGIKKPA